MKSKYQKIALHYQIWKGITQKDEVLLMEQNMDLYQNDALIQFAEDHSTFTMALLGRWPDIELEDKQKQADDYYRTLSEQMLLFAKENNIILTPEIRGQILLETLTNATDLIAGRPEEYESPEQYTFYKDNIFARAEQIMNLILHQQNVSNTVRIIIPPMEAPMLGGTEYIWGQHGAHFKQEMIAP